MVYKYIIFYRLIIYIMMDIVGIINDSLNNFIKKQRGYRKIKAVGHLVSKKSIIHKIGQYKEYNYQICYIDDTFNHHLIVEIKKVLPENIDSAVLIEVLQEIYTLIYEKGMIEQIILGKIRTKNNNC